MMGVQTVIALDPDMVSHNRAPLLPDFKRILQRRSPGNDVLQHKTPPVTLYLVLVSDSYALVIPFFLRLTVRLGIIEEGRVPLRL